MAGAGQRRGAGMLVLVAAAALVAGCGGDDAPSPTAPSGDVALGKAIFASNCVSCHTLADAEATGSNGPDLDELRPSFESVRRQVTDGGGGMPAFAGALSAADIDNVAAYVSGVAGR